MGLLWKEFQSPLINYSRICYLLNLQPCTLQHTLEITCKATSFLRQLTKFSQNLDFRIRPAQDVNQVQSDRLTQLWSSGPLPESVVLLLGPVQRCRICRGQHQRRPTSNRQIRVERVASQPEVEPTTNACSGIDFRQQVGQTGITWRRTLNALFRAQRSRGMSTVECDGRQRNQRPGLAEGFLVAHRWSEQVSNFTNTRRVEQFHQLAVPSERHLNSIWTRAYLMHNQLDNCYIQHDFKVFFQ